jgi:hypothetical protein
MFIALLTLPLILYGIAYIRRPELFARRWVASAASASATLIAALGLVYLIATSAHWRDGVEIAWTGVGTKTDRLAIGGRPEEAIIGWPNASR